MPMKPLLELLMQRAWSDSHITVDEHREIKRQLRVVRGAAEDVDRGIRGAMSYLRSSRLNPSVRARHGVRELPVDDDHEPEVA